MKSPPTLEAVAFFLWTAEGADLDAMLAERGWTADDVTALLPALVEQLACDDPDPIAMDLCGRSFHTVGDLATGSFLNSRTRPLVLPALPLLLPLLNAPAETLSMRAGEALA